MKQPVHLSVVQKHWIYLSLNFGAATAGELAKWSGVDLSTVYEIARSGFVNNSKRCRCAEFYKSCWL